jgi:hypothetical protein
VRRHNGQDGYIHIYRCKIVKSRNTIVVLNKYKLDLSQTENGFSVFKNIVQSRPLDTTEGIKGQMEGLCNVAFHNS